MGTKRRAGVESLGCVPRRGRASSGCGYRHGGVRRPGPGSEEAESRGWDSERVKESLGSCWWPHIPEGPGSCFSSLEAGAPFCSGILLGAPPTAPGDWREEGAGTLPLTLPKRRPEEPGAAAEPETVEMGGLPALRGLGERQPPPSYRSSPALEPHALWAAPGSALPPRASCPRPASAPVSSAIKQEGEFIPTCRLSLKLSKRMPLEGALMRPFVQA